MRLTKRKHASADQICLQTWVMRYVGALQAAYAWRPTTSLVLINLVSRSGSSGEAWPSYSTIAADCGVNCRSVRLALEQLKAARWRGIPLVEGHWDGRRSPTRRFPGLRRLHEEMAAAAQPVRWLQTNHARLTVLDVGDVGAGGAGGPPQDVGAGGPGEPIGGGQANLQRTTGRKEAGDPPPPRKMRSSICGAWPSWWVWMNLTPSCGASPQLALNNDGLPSWWRINYENRKVDETV